VDLSHTEKVAALDELAELVQDSGLRAAARALGTSHTWLLARLQMRQDPVIFPALEAGDISFMMADQLRRAPAPARRGLLDRVLRERPDAGTARKWVQAIRDHERGERAALSARIATDRDGTADPYDELVGQLQALGEPRTRKQRDALKQLVELGQRLMSVSRPAKRTAATAAD
jgi:hypothetical protein